MSARPPDRRLPYLGRAAIQPPVAADQATVASGGPVASVLHGVEVWLRVDLAGHVPYSSPRPWVGVRLDSNESPYPPTNGLRAKLADLARKHPWHRYGDLDAVALRTRLGEWHGHAAEGVWVDADALLWLSLELVVLLAPAQFRPAQRYVLAALALGLLVYGWLRLTDPTALTTQPTPPPPRRGEQSLWATEQEMAWS
jgi:hypothetical protein